jgi:hypothetical protein
MRVFKTKVFAGIARKWNMGDAVLWRAAMQANAGLMEADLGGEVIEQRLGRAAGSNDRGFRTFTFLRPGNRVVFVHGLAKNERAALRSDEIAALWQLAKLMLSYTSDEIAVALQTGALIEVVDDQTIS